MSRKIGKILRDAFWIRQKGLAQIPLMIALLLMAIAIPVVITLVQQQQDIRNKASYDCDQECAGIPEPGHKSCMDQCNAVNPPTATLPSECSTCDYTTMCIYTPCTRTVGGKEVICGYGILPCGGAGFEGECAVCATRCSLEDCFVGMKNCGKGGSAEACGGICGVCNASAPDRCKDVDCLGTNGEFCGKGTKECCAITCNGHCCNTGENCYHAYGSNYYCAAAQPGQCDCAKDTCKGATCVGTDNTVCSGAKTDGICAPGQPGQCECANNTCVGGTCTGVGGVACPGKKTGSDCGVCKSSDPCQCTTVNGKSGVQCCGSDGQWMKSECGEGTTCTGTNGVCLGPTEKKCGSVFANQKVCGSGDLTSEGKIMVCDGNTGALKTYTQCNENFHCEEEGGIPTCVTNYQECGSGENIGICSKDCKGSGDLVEVEGSESCVGGGTAGWVCCRNNTLAGPCEGGSKACGDSSRCKGGLHTVDFCNGGLDYVCCTEGLVCGEGDKKCEGGFTYTCLSDGSWGTKTECPTKQCDGQVCMPRTCTPGTSTCDSNYIATCNTEGTEFVISGSQCPYGCEMVGGKAQCAKQTCVPGTLKCVSGKSSTCNDDGTGYVNEFPCVYGCKTDGTACNQCDSTFQKRCNGNQVVECVDGVMTPKDCADPKCNSCTGDGVCKQTVFGGECPEGAPTSTPTPTPTPITGGPTSGPTSGPTGPVACDCRNNRSAKIDRADANCDGKTDILDASIWRSESKDLGGTETNKATWLADFNCDGFVNDLDRDIWLEKYTNSLPFAK